MKLYRIKTLLAAPKDIHHSIMGYIIAKDDVEVMKYVDETYCYGKWADAISDGQVVTEYNDEDPDISSDLSYEEWILKHKGDLDDDDWSDAYYGITKFGWEEIKIPDILNADVLMEDLERIGIATRI